VLTKKGWISPGDTYHGHPNEVSADA